MGVISIGTASIGLGKAIGGDTFFHGSYVSSNYTYFNRHIDSQIQRNGNIDRIKIRGRAMNGTHSVKVKIFRPTSPTNWTFVGDVVSFTYVGNATFSNIVQEVVPSFPVQAGDILAIYDDLGALTSIDNVKIGSVSRVAGDQSTNIDPSPLLVFNGPISLKAYEGSIALNGTSTIGTLDTTTSSGGYDAVDRSSTFGNANTWVAGGADQQFTSSGNVYKVEVYNPMLMTASKIKFKIFYDSGGVWVQRAESGWYDLPGGGGQSIFYLNPVLPVQSGDRVGFALDNAAAVIDAGVVGTENSNRYQWTPGDSSGGSFPNLGGPNPAVYMHVGTKGTIEVDP